MRSHSSASPKLSTSEMPKKQRNKQSKRRRGGASACSGGGSALALETIAALEHSQLSPHYKAAPDDRRRLQKALTSACYIPNNLDLWQRPDDDSAQPTRIVLYRGGSLEAAEWASRHLGTCAERKTTSSEWFKPAVLDFASDSNPGGGWRGGQQGTQEESICRASSLGLSLENITAASPCYSIPSAGSVYVPDVVVVRHEDSARSWREAPLWCAVVAAALRHADDNLDFVRSKIQGVMAVATGHGHGAFVGGAWGCGAFGNDAAIVAEAWRVAAKRSGLSLLVLALPSKQLLKTFQSILPEASVIDKQQTS